MSLSGKYLEKFLSRIQKSDGCWTWNGAHIGTGYPETWDGVRPLLAHRVAHELWNGPIPEGYEVDHLCRNRSCVNPEHLEAVPGKVNNMRSRSAAALNARKTHCSNGHEFTPENTGYRSANGARWCRECNRVAMAARPKNPRTLKTHCPQGHPLSGENLAIYTKKNGNKDRRCKACARDRMRSKRREP